MEKKNTFALPQKRVRVEPVLEHSGWITDRNHKAFFKMEGTFDWFTVPTLRKGVYKNILTNDEKEYLENLIGNVDLGVYKKEGTKSFWSNYSVKLDRYGKTLDLSNPNEFIDYKVLLASSSLICPNHKDRLAKAEYKYYIVDEQEVAKAKKTDIDVKKKAYKALGKIEDDKNALIEFLKVHSLTTTGNVVKIDKSSDIEFLQEQVSVIVDANAKKFVEFVEDDYFNVRVALAKGLEVGAVRKTDAGYENDQSLILGSSVHAAVTFLSNDRNQEVLFLIEEKIKQTE